MHAFLEVFLPSVVKMVFRVIHLQTAHLQRSQAKAVSLSALLCPCAMTPPPLWTLFFHILIKLFQCDAGDKASSPSHQRCFEQARAEGSGKSCLHTKLIQPCSITVSPAPRSSPLVLLQKAVKPRPCLPYFLCSEEGCQEPQLKLCRTVHGAHSQNLSSFHTPGLLQSIFGSLQARFI